MAPKLGPRIRFDWALYCNDMKTVYRAFNPADAQLVRSRLEAAGFHSVVTNELSALSMDGYAMAAGGILVEVPDEEAAEAAEFLANSTEIREEEGQG
jgi:Putative prokaryotic signal transducing protein